MNHSWWLVIYPIMPHIIPHYTISYPHHCCFYIQFFSAKSPPNCHNNIIFAEFYRINPIISRDIPIILVIKLSLSLYTYIYIYTYIDAYIYTYTYTFTFTYTYIHTYIHVYNIYIYAHPLYPIIVHKNLIPWNASRTLLRPPQSWIGGAPHARNEQKIGIETPTFGVKATKLVICQQKHVVSGDILVYLSHTNSGATYGDKTSKHLIKHGDISSKKGELNCLYSRGYFIPGSGQSMTYPLVIMANLKIH